MDKVWIVTLETQSDCRCAEKTVEGVFSTQERADAFIAKKGWKSWEASADEWEMDKE